MKVRDVLKMLRGDGWFLRNQEGSHRQFIHPGKPRGYGRWTRVRRDAAENAEVYNEASRHSMNKFPVLFEKSSTGYGAYAPDLPGCVATGRTLEETRKRMAKAMEMHLSSMRQDGDPIPEPSHFELVEAV